MDVSNGSTGVFLPKPTHKRHIPLAPTLSTVQNGEVAVAVLNLEGGREKLSARAELGTWIPTDETMKILSLNGELDRERVAQWVVQLRDLDTKPLSDKADLDIGDMAPSDRALVIALLRQYAFIVEKKDGCPPLSTTDIEHH